MNGGKSKVRWCNREGMRDINVSWDGEVLEEVECLKYWEWMWLRLDVWNAK